MERSDKKQALYTEIIRTQLYFCDGVIRREAPRIEAETGCDTARAIWRGHSPLSIWKDPGCWQVVVIFWSPALPSPAMLDSPNTAKLDQTRPDQLALWALRGTSLFPAITFRASSTWGKPRLLRARQLCTVTSPCRGTWSCAWGERLFGACVPVF